MKNATKWTNYLTTAALPLAFFGSGFLNILVFPLGLHNYDTARTLITFGILGAAALFLFVRVALLYAKAPELRRPVLAASLILVLFGLIYLWALAFQADKLFILEQALVQGCYLVSAWSALILILAEKRLRSFLRACRICALIISPIILYYCIRFYLPGADYYSRSLGNVVYMSLAYTLLTVCVALLLEVLLYDGAGSEKAAAFFRVDLSLILLFSAAIALSGTKGPILCFLFNSALAVLYLIKKGGAPRRRYLPPLAACLSLLLFSFVLFPNSEVDNRLKNFLGELSSGADPSAVEESAGNAFDAMSKIQGDSFPVTMDSIVNAVESGRANAQLESGNISQEEHDALVAFSKTVNNTATGGRLYLWTSALEEIRSAPLTGQGPFFFQAKYGTYPHNFFLEVATDFGLPITLAILCLGLYVFFRLIRLSLRFPACMAFTLYVLTFLPRAMLSGAIYDCSTFSQYGFCILFVFFCQNPRAKDVFEGLGSTDGVPAP